MTNLNISQKLIKSHLVEGEMVPGEEIGIHIDQTLTQDATGTGGLTNWVRNQEHIKSA